MRIPHFTDKQIVALRPEVQRPEPGSSPLSVFVEREAQSAQGQPEAGLTIMLRGSECRFRCLMCDLWKHTFPGRTPAGSLPAQIRQALDQPTERSPATERNWVKLYNASNFFSSANVPPEDLPEIAELTAGFPRVVVENHPKLLNSSICDFRDAIRGRLEIAMGLETTHPEALKRLNKRMHVDDFRAACDWLISRNIDVRCFVLLKPPGFSEQAAMDWCSRSIEFATDCGVRFISVIPVRAGNGILEQMSAQNLFEPPRMESLEQIIASHLPSSSAILTVDVWDWDRLRGGCPNCSVARRQRLQDANLYQKFDSRFQPTCCG